MTACLLILNDPPYGTERSYNGLRLAGSLARAESDHVRVFLMGDAVVCANKDQKPPTGHYNLEVMLRSVARRGGEIGVCGSCMDARGIGEGELVEGGPAKQHGRAHRLDGGSGPGAGVLKVPMDVVLPSSYARWRSTPLRDVT